jgi:hypothetical protein
VSGGFVDDQSGEGEHQLVVFTFIGNLDPTLVAEWNNRIADLKARFNADKIHLAGVTIKAATTSPQNMERQKPKR